MSQYLRWQPEVFCKKNFAKIHRKIYASVSVFNKVAGLRSAILLKKTPTQVLSCEPQNGRVERVKNWKVLGVIFDENSSWNLHINEVVRSCLATLSVLRKLKRYANHNRRKQLVEALNLSKIDYAVTILSNTNKMEINRFHKALKSTALFVTSRFCHTTDVINLKWLPNAERINYYQLKLARKTIYEKTFPNYLKLTFKNRK